MWIEQHGRQHRVVWRTAARRDVEPFATRDDAERFRLAAGLLSRGVEEARALVCGPAHAPEQVPATLAVATAARPTRRGEVTGIAQPTDEAMSTDGVGTAVPISTACRAVGC